MLAEAIYASELRLGGSVHGRETGGRGGCWSQYPELAPPGNAYDFGVKICVQILQVPGMQFPELQAANQLVTNSTNH